ncbi:MAG: thiamine biosynthesis lipoprotein precursor [Actinomycetia bacterium]|nr:thiamine biosynthesis lipoprotein precursor [Actinomycetes bacterium]
MRRSRIRVEHIWGTAISLDLRGSAGSDAADDVFAWFHRVDDLFSTWRPDSEISRLGRGITGLGDVSTEVRTVLDLCDRVKQESGGAFDARFASDPRVVMRDGFGPIDPSGLVKGWALQRAGEMLRDRGARDFTVNAGGDVLAAGRPGAGAAWRIGIQHPWQRDKLAMVLAVSDVGVATSGRYERGDHVVDPRTGRSATDLMAVTVVHEDLALADGYATAALALGDGGPRWLAEMGLAAAAISEDAIVTSTRALADMRAS